jgi:hypothetical protein
MLDLPAIRPKRRLGIQLTASRAAVLERLRTLRTVHADNGNYLRISRAFDAFLTEVEALLSAEDSDHLPDDADGDVRGVPEGRALVITAPSFCGKSHLIDRLVTDERLRSVEEYGVRVRPFLAVRAPSPCNIKTLGLAFLKALGADPGRKVLDTYLIWHAVGRHLVAQGVSVVLIDEFHNVLVGKNRDELDKLAAALKSLLTGEIVIGLPETAPASFAATVNDTSARSPVFLVLAGTRRVNSFTSDFSTEDREQLSRRCENHPFREVPVKNSGDDGAQQFTGLKDFVELLTAKIGIPIAPELLSEDGQKRFYKAGWKHLGRVAHLLKTAARIAILTDAQTISPNHMAKAFELLYKTGPLRNCFLVVDIDACAFPPAPWQSEGRAREAT